MAEPYTDADFENGHVLVHIELDGAGMSDAARATLQEFLDRVVATFRHLAHQRDQAIDDARFLSECAAKLLHGGDVLIEEATETMHDEVQRHLRRMFDPLRLSDVMSRYADVEPVTVQEHDEAEVANG